MTASLIRVENLHKYFPIKSRLVKSGLIKSLVIPRQIESVKAVLGVSFDIKKGETLGLVGESGCGKSTLGRCILRLLNCTKGKIYYREENITDVKDLKAIRRKMQVIFQDPYSSLNPKMTLNRIISEPLIIHKLCNSKKDIKDRVKELMQTVGLREDMISRYPHELSGGQRQRVGIARALAVNPEFIICDEPVSALDVSIQAQIINLLKDLQEKFGLAYLFISHDLKVVKHISHRVAVMYLGRIVEIANSLEIYENPKHPYTKALMSAILIPDPNKNQEDIILRGDVPSSIDLPKGCAFHPRCPIAIEECHKQTPLLMKAGSSHQVACIKAK